MLMNVTNVKLIWNNTYY